MTDQEKQNRYEELKRFLNKEIREYAKIPDLYVMGGHEPAVLYIENGKVGFRLTLGENGWRVMAIWSVPLDTIMRARVACDVVRDSYPDVWQEFKNFKL